jgi:two-component sensor histidine kinase
MRARFPGDLTAPASARLFVSGHLAAVARRPWAPPNDDVVLIVSELVTNSVRAGATTVDVQVQADADRVDLEVTDDAAGWPAARIANLDDLGGRGLSIVELLADSWTTTARHPGKTVTVSWFRGRRT